MHYTGYFPDGKQFDSSYNWGEPYAFTLGAGQVIKGWDQVNFVIRYNLYPKPSSFATKTSRLVQGLIDMCIGEQRKLTIPSDLAYGDSGLGDIIPGGATLIFDVELVEIIDTM